MARLGYEMMDCRPVGLDSPFHVEREYLLYLITKRYSLLPDGRVRVVRDLDDAVCS